MVLIVHPEVATDAVKAIFAPIINTPKDKSVVDPKSVVVVSVKLTVDPDQIEVIWPARALLPDLAVYSNQAPS